MDDYKYFWMDWKDFSGETDKATFWWVSFMHIGVFVALVPLLFVFPGYVYQYFALAYLIAILVPQTAMVFRRFHDGHINYFHFLWLLIPVFGQFIFLGVLMIEVDYGGDERISDKERRELRAKQEELRYTMNANTNNRAIPRGGFPRK
ncbi:MAG: DUF805 domain-containing protein [Candidatus Izemoplasma sp.]